MGQKKPPNIMQNLKKIHTTLFKKIKKCTFSILGAWYPKARIFDRFPYGSKEALYEPLTSCKNFKKNIVPF